MRIKKGDKIKIITGKDAGKSGKVLFVDILKERISAEGLNLRFKHVKPRKSGEKGQRIQFPATMNVTNVKLVCPKCDKETRVGYKILENNKKVRFCKKCQETF